MEAIDVVRSHYAASEAGDPQAMVADFAEDIQWTEASGMLYAGQYVGPEAVLANVFGPISEQWEDFAVEVDTLITQGETVVGVGTYRGLHAGTRAPLEARVVHVWTVREGQIVAFEQVTDTAMWRRAAGLGVD